jgi:hypothetical protein
MMQKKEYARLKKYEFRQKAGRSSEFELPVGEWQALAWACLKKKDLVFFDGDSALLADFDARFAAQAFFFIHCHGLAILKFVNFNRADIYAFAITSAFVDIDGNRITHDLPPKFFKILAYASWIRDPYTPSKKL